MVSHDGPVMFEELLPLFTFLDTPLWKRMLTLTTEDTLGICCKPLISFFNRNVALHLSTPTEIMSCHGHG